MKRTALIFGLIFCFLVPGLALANNIYSTISTTFNIQRQVNCDRLVMKFRVWAEGNTFSEALKRLKPINNDFLKFLNKIYKKNEVKSQVNYNGERTAQVIISIDTHKVLSAPRVLGYISSRHFPYQTGIDIVNLRYSLSEKKLNEVKSNLFKEALTRSKTLLRIINANLNRKYAISKISVNYSQPFTIANSYPTRMFLQAKSKPKSPMQTAVGKRIVKATVNFSAIALIK